MSEAGYSYSQGQGKSARSLSPKERPPKGSARDSGDRFSSVSEACYSYSQGQGKSARSLSPKVHPAKGSARDSGDRCSSVSEACYSYSKDQGNSTRSHSPMQHTLKVSTKDSRYRYSSVRENEDERRPITRRSRSPSEHYPVNIVKPKASVRSSEERDYSDTEQEIRYLRKLQMNIRKRERRESAENYLLGRNTEDKRRRTRSPSPIEHHFPEKAVKGPSARSSEERDSSDIEEIRHVKHDKKGDGKRKATDSTERYFSVRDTEDKIMPTGSHSQIGGHFPEKAVKGNRQRSISPSARSSKERDFSDREQETRNMRQEMKAIGKRKILRESTEDYLPERDTEDKRRRTRSPSPIERHFAEKAGKGPSARSSEECDSSDIEEIKHVKRDKKGDGKRKATDSTEHYFSVRDTEDKIRPTRSRSPTAHHLPENLKEKRDAFGKTTDRTERYSPMRHNEDKRRTSRSHSPKERDLPQNLKQKEKHDGNRKGMHSTESCFPVKDTSELKRSFRSLSPIESSLNMEEDSYSIQGKGKSVRNRSARSSQKDHFSEMGEETDLNREKRKPRCHSPTRHSEEEDCPDT
ncbi:MAG: hypothetical protein MJE68_06685, partial [Proteobacteria bacterium]|nr:hypothetical protein [Pseudomonadota bacterium]